MNLILNMNYTIGEIVSCKIFRIYKQNTYAKNLRGLQPRFCSWGRWWLCLCVTEGGLGFGKLRIVVADGGLIEIWWLWLGIGIFGMLWEPCFEAFVSWWWLWFLKPTIFNRLILCKQKHSTKISPELMNFHPIFP